MIRSREIEVVDVRWTVTRTAGLRVIGCCLDGNRIQTVDRNFVVWKSRANVSTLVVWCRSQWVVNCHRFTARVKQLRKISAKLLCLRDGISRAVEAGVAHPLICEHKKQLVFAVDDLRNINRPIGEKTERVTVA